MDVDSEYQSYRNLLHNMAPEVVFNAKAEGERG